MTARAPALTHSTLARGARVAVLTVLATVAAMLAATGARAGTYPMYQCGSASSAVAPGWSVYSFTTVASTVLEQHVCQRWRDRRLRLLRGRPVP